MLNQFPHRNDWQWLPNPSWKNYIPIKHILCPWIGQYIHSHPPTNTSNTVTLTTPSLTGATTIDLQYWPVFDKLNNEVLPATKIYRDTCQSLVFAHQKAFASTEALCEERLGPFFSFLASNKWTPGPAKVHLAIVGTLPVNK